MQALSPSLVFTLLLTSVGTGALAGLLLALECFAGGSTPARAIRAILANFLTAKVLGAGLLMASLLGSRFLAAHLLAVLNHDPDQQVVDLEDVPVLDHTACTDRGSSIALFHFAIHTSAAEIERFMQASEEQQRRVIRLADANPAANCHGWVFTGGAFGVRDSELPKILTENEYVLVPDGREGDLALYVRDGQITHSGLARRPDPNGPLLVESKWGPFGLYLHPPEKQPFSGICQFHRSPRAGHLLILSGTDLATHASE